jgi:hypothetical protein
VPSEVVSRFGVPAVCAAPLHKLFAFLVVCTMKGEPHCFPRSYNPSHDIWFFGIEKKLQVTEKLKNQE